MLKRGGRRSRELLRIGGLMPRQRYTPGHSATAVGFMAARSAESHAAFFLPELRTGMSLLDCGCGPGTITVGLATAVMPGEVCAVDVAEDQFEAARTHAADAGVVVDLRAASVYRLPFDNDHFQAVFAHALLEHLADPIGALREIKRVARPGAVIGVCSPDWGAFILSPPDREVTFAVDRYCELQRANGGEPLAGRHLSGWLQAAELKPRAVAARYECYPDSEMICRYLAEQLDAAGSKHEADALRRWGTRQISLFAQAWVSAVADA